jgi:hypothetical protein
MDKSRNTYIIFYNQYAHTSLTHAPQLTHGRSFPKKERASPTVPDPFPQAQKLALNLLCFSAVRFYRRVETDRDRPSKSSPKRPRHPLPRQGAQHIISLIPQNATAIKVVRSQQLRQILEVEQKNLALLNGTIILPDLGECHQAFRTRFIAEFSNALNLIQPTYLHAFQDENY